MTDMQQDIQRSKEALLQGGVILYPTDTIWGLGCDGTHEAAIQRIFQIKHRSQGKSMIILVSGPEMIRRYVHAPSALLLREMEESPVPVTAVFNGAEGLPAALTGADGSIAIRIPLDPFCMELLQQFDKPIVSTSANISAQAPPHNFAEIDPALIREVDYVVGYRQDDLAKKDPSRIIRLNELGEVERVR